MLIVVYRDKIILGKKGKWLAYILLLFEQEFLEENLMSTKGKTINKYHL